MGSAPNSQYAALNRARTALLVALMLTAIGLSAFAQGDRGRISGSVTDSTGAVVPNAKVTVLDTLRGTSQNLVSNAEGLYVSAPLVPSTYSVRVQTVGFKGFERTNIIVETGQEIRVNASLETGAAAETITVSASLPMINTENSILGGTLQNKEINDLPLNGRDYQQLLTIRPGVFQYAGGGSYTQSTNGIRPDTNGWMLDGHLNADPGNGRSIIGVQSPFTDAATLMPIDAIQEFSTEISPRANIGWKTGASVVVAVKSGTNQIHGTAYAFGRNGSWDARNYFNPSPQPVAPLNLIQWGATAGGPIKKDKLFYFGAFETYRNELGNPLTINAPASQSVGSPKNSIPDAIAALKARGIAISAVSQSLLQLYPANATSSTQVNTSFANTNTSYNGIGKINYLLNDHHSISGFFYMARYDGVGQTSSVVDEQFLQHQPLETKAIGFNWIYTPNARWVNEFRFGASRSWGQTLGNDAGIPATSYGLNTGVTNQNGMPLTAIKGFNSIGDSANGGTSGPSPFYRWDDEVTYTRGKHSFMFGGEYGWGVAEGQGIGYVRGTFTFNGGQAFSGATSLEDFLAGKVTTATLNTPTPPDRSTVRTQTAVFGQDDWRLTQRLTLNLGLRYEYLGIPHETHGILGNFLPAVGLVQQDIQFKQLYAPYHTQFSPRFGMAWDVFGKGRDVVRGGYSLMYEAPTLSYLTQGLTSVPTGALLNGVPGPGNISTSSTTYTGSQLNWPLQPGSSTPIFPSSGGTTSVSSCTTAKQCAIYSIDPNFTTPYVQQWSFGIQHAFTNAISLEVNYVGNHGSNLLGITNRNAAPLGAGFCMNNPLTAAQIAAGCVPGKPITDPTAVNPKFEQAAFPFYTQYAYLASIIEMKNMDWSNYNALQSTLNLRNYHGVTVTAGYTYQHALDTNSIGEYTIPPDPSTGNNNHEYGNSDFDMRHRLTVAFSYAIPGKKSPGQLLQGWQVNGIATLQTPQPWTEVDTGNDLSGIGNINVKARKGPQGDRWNFTGKRSDFKSHGTDGIPWIPGDLNVANAPTTDSTCNAAATTPGQIASLRAFGCFKSGNSVLTPPAPGTLGTDKRNPFPDTGFQNLSASVYKNWRFQERYGVQFRAEFFNVLNHPNFENPYGSVGGYGVGQFNDPSSTTTFGCGCATPDVGAGNPVTGSGSMRAVQLGLKLLF
jgi:hypothetical protein